MIENASMSQDARLRAQVPRLFVYGLLKRGQVLSLSLPENGPCKFVGEAIIPNAILYNISFGVGLRFETKVGVECANGEVFEIPLKLWSWLDKIENNGVTYTRKIVPVHIIGHGSEGEPIQEEMQAWVYEHTYPNMEYTRPIRSGVFG